MTRIGATLFDSTHDRQETDMSTPMITEHAAVTQSILRTLHAWLIGETPGYDTRDQLLEGAYGIIATTAGECSLPGATIDDALQMAVKAGLITAAEAARYTGVSWAPLASAE